MFTHLMEIRIMILKDVWIVLIRIPKLSMVELEKREVLGKVFRIYGDKENPLFLAKDVADWIDYSFKDKSKGTRNVNMMLQMIDEEEKVKRIMGMQQSCHPSLHGGIRANTEMWFLTEDGLYEVLMQSRKPIAKGSSVLRYPYLYEKDKSWSV